MAALWLIAGIALGVYGPPFIAWFMTEMDRMAAPPEEPLSLEELLHLPAHEARHPSHRGQGRHINE